MSRFQVESAVKRTGNRSQATGDSVVQALNRIAAVQRVQSLQWAISHYWQLKTINERSHMAPLRTANSFEYWTTDGQSFHSDDLLPAILSTLMMGYGRVLPGVIPDKTVDYMFDWSAFKANAARRKAAHLAFGEKLRDWIHSLIGEDPKIEQEDDGSICISLR